MPDFRGFMPVFGSASKQQKWHAVTGTVNALKRVSSLYIITILIGGEVYGYLPVFIRSLHNVN